jgi:tetratricopeptide (TPR) repeat protein
LRTGILCAVLAALLLLSAPPPSRAADPPPTLGDCRDEGPPFDRTIDRCTAILADRKLAARDRAAAFRIRAYARLQLADSGGGMADLDQSIALDSKNPTSFTLRSGARAAAGDLPGALEDATQALRLRPDDPALLLARAAIYVRQQRFDQAHADATRVIALAPDSAAYRTRAEICLAGSTAAHGTPPPCDLAAALADIRQAETAARDTATEIAALLVEGRLWEAQDQPAKAIAAYEAGLDADEACQDCLAAERRLQAAAAQPKPAAPPAPPAPQAGQGAPAAQPTPPANRPPPDPLIARINAGIGRAVAASGGKLLVTTGLRLAEDGRLEILAYACPGLTPKSPKAKIEACRTAAPSSGETALRFTPADIDPATVRMESSAHTYRVQFQCKSAQPCIARPDAQPAQTTAALACPNLPTCNGLALALSSLLAELSAATP